MATNNASNEPTGTAGKVMQSQGAGVANALSTPTYPSASGTARKMLVADGTNNVYSTETWAVPGTSGNVLTSDGTNWTSAASSSPTNIGGLGRFYIYDDFMGNLSAGSGASNNLGNTNINTQHYGGTNPTSSDVSASGHPGVIQIVQNTGAGGCGNSLGNAYGLFSGEGTITAQWVVQLPTLSTASPRYIMYIGLMNKTATGVPTKGCWFQYSDNVNSGNWTINTSGASTTTANTSTAADTSWHNYKVILNAAGTSVSFYIDNVQVANSPISTNLPNATFGNQVALDSSVGNGNTFNADLYITQVDLTTTRPG